ncbi:hypothetical protein PWR05_32050, partial [Paraburkholderia sp. A2RI-6]|uniref:hypothetical protein n=1 Tax=Paraburkholderia sp. A2RI-6 TaxID=3028371 RepID=UPI003B76A0AA
MKIVSGIDSSGTHGEPPPGIVNCATHTAASPMTNPIERSMAAVKVAVAQYPGAPLPGLVFSSSLIAPDSVHISVRIAEVIAGASLQKQPVSRILRLLPMRIAE